MTFDNFCEMILNMIVEELGEKHDISLQTCWKNNGEKRMVLLIQTEGCNMSPTIYLNEFFRDFEQGLSLNEIRKQIVHVFEENAKKESFNVSEFVNWNKAKNHIFPKVINTAANLDLLKDIPHHNILNLSCVFYYEANVGNCGHGTILIHNAHMDHWNIGMDELVGQAMKNEEEQHGMELSSLMMNLMGEEVDDMGELGMYVLTNKEKLFGASRLLMHGDLLRIGKFLRGSYFILPSSIHELLIIRDSGDTEASELADMVKEVNQLEVSVEERLSDSVYYYNASTKEIRIVA